MPIKDQCLNCKYNNSKGCISNTTVVFDGTSCEYYMRREIDLSKPSKELEESIQNVVSSNNNEIINDGQEQQTSDERIGGWLVVYLFAMNIGAVVSFFTSLIYAGTYEYSSWDVMFSGMLLALSVFATIRFINKKSDAIFLGKSYLVACVLINLFVLIVGDNTSEEINKLVRSLGYSLIWFVYLSYSKQVNRLFPKDTRILKGFDYWIIIALIIVPLASYGMMLNSELKKYTEITAADLKTGEYTDGRIIFMLPDEYEIEKISSEDYTLLSITSDVASATICSDYTDEFTKESFEDNWQSWKDEDFDVFDHDILKNTLTMINNNFTYVKVTKYTTDPIVYWCYGIVNQEKSGKEAMVTFYSIDNINYYDDFIEILSNIRFNK